MAALRQCREVFFRRSLPQPCDDANPVNSHESDPEIQVYTLTRVSPAAGHRRLRSEVTVDTAVQLQVML